MEPSQLNAGVPAEAATCPTSSDEPLHHNNEHTQPRLPLHSTYGFLAPHTSQELSPPQERTHGRHPSVSNGFSRYKNHQQGFSNAISNETGLNHPPTPPRQDDEYDMLRKWHVQQSRQEQHGSDGAASHNPQSITSKAPIDTHDYAESFAIPQPPNVRRQWGSHAKRSSIRQLSAPPGISNEFQQPRLFGLPPQRLQYNGEIQQHVSRNFESRMQPPRLNQYSGTLPLPYQLQTVAQLSPSQPAPSNAPPIQQWPTQVLDRQTTLQHTSHQPIASLNDPSPGNDGGLSPDKKTLKKKEKFHKRAEEKRRQQQAMAGNGTPRTRKSSTTGGPKRQSLDQLIDLTSPTIPPSFRHSHVPGTHALQPHNLGAYMLPAGFAGYGSMYGPGPPPRYTQNLPYASTYDFSDFTIAPAPRLPTPPPPPPTDWDHLPQAIVPDYEDYKCSVTLYEISPETQQRYDFAQSWLEDLLKMNIDPYPKDYKWHTQSTLGMISNGTRFSLLVLHNATDPFEWGAKSETSTTIGVYGAHWYAHEDIHWKTISPGIGWLFQWCLEQGGIVVKKKWRCDEEKASEKRFHRAYWLAANMRDINTLLNRGSSDDVAHDAVDEDGDGEFEVGEEDLTRGWNLVSVSGEIHVGGVHEDGAKEITKEESRAAWKKILGEVEGQDMVGYQHVVTGCSEWI
ncbi:hypothetical protein EK21DRAFT_112667 [Setomelanomma holmii]|uniref:Uncharacterized protein n=1 Tax=Setomelanomma holmii TaxID=210430 RepID=A0A9P4LN74_9PLEO|nr:hypothetical protein EK21DRAFT_112667 [Setomelanomma holmii]